MNTTISYMTEFEHRTIFEQTGAVRLRYKVIEKLVADGWNRDSIDEVIAWSGNMARYSPERKSLLFRQFVDGGDMVVIEVLKTGVSKVHYPLALIVPDSQCEHAQRS